MKVYVAHIFVRQLDIIRTVCCCFVDVRKIFFGGFLGRRPDEYLFWMFRRGGTFRKDIISIRVTRRLPFVKICMNTEKSVLISSIHHVPAEIQLKLVVDHFVIFFFY